MKKKPTEKSQKTQEPEQDFLDIIPEEVKEKIPEDELKRLAISVKASWSAPYPPPSIFNQYPLEVRKAIISQTTDQMKHRHKVEKKVIDSDISAGNKAMHYAGAITIILIIAGVVLLLSDKTVEGLFALFGLPVFHVGNFVLQKRKEVSEVRKRAVEDNKKDSRQEKK